MIQFLRFNSIAKSSWLSSDQVLVLLAFPVTRRTCRVFQALLRAGHQPHEIVRLVGCSSRPNIFKVKSAVEAGKDFFKVKETGL